MIVKYYINNSIIQYLIITGSGNASPQVRVNNGINMNNIRGNQQQQSLYSMGNSSNYGYARLQQQQQQQQKGHYQPLPTRYFIKGYVLTTKPLEDREFQ